jgi:hypothetical protein
VPVAAKTKPAGYRKLPPERIFTRSLKHKNRRLYAMRRAAGLLKDKRTPLEFGGALGVRAAIPEEAHGPHQDVGHRHHVDDAFVEASHVVVVALGAGGFHLAFAHHALGLGGR